MQHFSIQFQFAQRFFGIAICVAALSACASGVKSSPETISVFTSVEEHEVYGLDSAVSFTLDTGYVRALKINSKWSPVGQILKGKVYLPNADVFSIEGTHVHEAYLVVDRGNLVGFYLPVERSFSPLGQFVPINLRKQ